MATSYTGPKTLHITLWVAQTTLAAGLIWASAMKLFQPVEALPEMWPWAGEVPAAMVKFTGIIDLLGGLGLILPAFLRIKPKLTPVAACCVIALMICASVFHISRGESSDIGVNIIFMIIAAFIAWGRFKKAHITPR